MCDCENREKIKPIGRATDDRNFGSVYTPMQKQSWNEKKKIIMFYDFDGLN